MKILKVIHGYPPRYSAGSEVYSKTLCHQLVEMGHEVTVFTREEDAYKQEYTVTWEKDPDCEDIRLCLVNMAHSRDGYRHTLVDQAFANLLDEYQPEIVHVGHLNHLSTSLLFEAKKRQIPIVFTLHDFWLMCPRGQFLQATNSKTPNLYPVCDSQNNKKCASKCYSRYFSTDNDEQDLAYWTGWVSRRMQHAKEICELVDLFIAPSRYLMNRFINDFSLSRDKTIYLDYGFHLERLQNRQREKEEEFVFGYIGTHKQAKGIHHLIEAFSKLKGKAKLKIWGEEMGLFTRSLKKIASRLFLSIEWMGGYRNENIVADVFNKIDAIVVPSIWGENSPLVLHEATGAGLPAITADYGGMKEQILHEKNGLLFAHRDPKDLAKQMQRFVDNPALAKKLGKVGEIPNIIEHTKEICELYKRCKNEKETRPLAHHI
ncbi:MAG: glycosyltransferase family 4 protein [Chlamydiales bacterium]